MPHPGDQLMHTTPPVIPPRSKRRTATASTAVAATIVASASSTSVRTSLQPNHHHRPLAGMKTTHERDYKRLHVAMQPVWPAIARLMQFSEPDIAQLIPDLAFRFELSEAEALLQLWGDQLNHNLTELFVLLGRAKQFEAMRAVQHLVPVAYLVLMPTPPLAAVAATTTTETNKNSGTEDSAAVVESKQHPKPAADAKPLNVQISIEENPTAQRPPAAAAAANGDGGNEGLRQRLVGFIPYIEHAELLTATRNWSASNVLGAGGFGTVYSGRWKQTMVAIKRVKSATVDRESLKLEQQQGLNELRHLNACRHDNIVPLYGYSLEPNGDPCLVYQLMVGGSLERRLAGGGGQELLWWDRMVVALGTAKGLQYLHTVNSIPIIHGDIKPANILLDECCRPKIGDFGLTRYGECDDADIQVSRVFGTRYYLPDEVMLNKTLSTKVDTYSFGIVLLELATGLRVFRKASYGHLRGHVERCKNVAELMPQLGDDQTDGGYTFRSLLGVGRDCCARDSANRPEMVTVLGWLEGMFKCKLGVGM